MRVALTCQPRVHFVFWWSVVVSLVSTLALQYWHALLSLFCFTVFQYFSLLHRLTHSLSPPPPLSLSPVIVVAIVTLWPGTARLRTSILSMVLESCRKALPGQCLLLLSDVDFQFLFYFYSKSRLVRTPKGNEKEYVLNKVRSIQSAMFVIGKANVITECAY